MITTYSSRDYRITYQGIALIENALDRPDLVQVSVTSDCVILVAPQKEYGIDYEPNGEYRSWNMQGANTQLARAEAHFIYARLNRTDRNALLLFSVNDYTTDGRIIKEQASGEGGEPVIEGDPSEYYYYIKIGSITKTDSLTKPTLDREAIIDFGYLTTPAELNEDFFTKKTDKNGFEYIITKYPIVTEQGITAYSSTQILIPSIFDGLPLDNKTIWKNPETGLIEVKGGTGGGGDFNSAKMWELLLAATDEQINKSHLTDALNGYATQSWVTSLGYVTQNDLGDTYVKKAGDTMTGNLTINAPTNSRLSLSDGTGILSVTEIPLTGQRGLALYGKGGIQITSDTVAFGVFNIGNKLKFSTVTMYEKNGVVYLDGDIAVTGGITAYAQGNKSVSTIMDGVIVDDTTISKEGGYLHVIGGVGGASNWDDLEGKPTWITDTKPTVSDFTNDAGYITNSALSGYATQSWVKSQGYLTNSSLNGYATENWVTSLGYITQTNADSRYVNVTGDTMTGALSTPQINGGGSTLLIGNSGNKSYVKFQEDVKQLNDNWSIGNNGAASFASVSASGVVRGDGGFITNSSTMLKLSRYTYQEVLTYGWNSTYGDFVDFKIPSSSPQTKYTKLSWNKGFDIFCNFRVTDGNIRIIDTSWTAVRYLFFSEGDTDTYGGYLKYTGADNLILGTRNNSTTDVDALRVKRGSKDVTVYGNLLVEGGVTCYTSDKRAKKIIENVDLSLKQIADAPTIRFKWNDLKIKDDGKTHIGGIAQYMQELLPETVLEDDGFLNMDYSITAYMFSVQTARHLLKTDTKLERLEKEIKRLKKQLKKLGYEEANIMDDKDI